MKTLITVYYLGAKIGDKMKLITQKIILSCALIVTANVSAQIKDNKHLLPI